MKRCKACGVDEDKHFKALGKTFTSPFGFCPECHKEFSDLMKYLRIMYCEARRYGNELAMNLNIKGKGKKPLW